MAARLVVLLLLACVVPAQKPGLEVGEEQLRALAARAVPAVERACGRSFTRAPNVVLADARDMASALRDDMLPATAAFFAGQPERRIEKALQLRADLLGSAMLGKYGAHSGVVYVVPEAVSSALARVAAADADHEQVLQLVVVHELVHALQDQEIGLRARLARHAGEDEGEAFSMLIEGHAVFCSERAAADLGLQAAIGPLRSVFAGARDPQATPAADLPGRRLRAQNAMRYLASAAFFAAEHARGGDDRCWQLLATERPTTRLLLEGPDRTPRQSLAGAFAGIEDRLAGRNWTVGRGDLSGVLVRGENAPASKDLEPLLAGWTAGGEWFAMSPTPLFWRALYALSFDTEAGAAAFQALAEKVASTDLEELDIAGRATGDGPPVDGASTRRIRQEPIGGRATIVWVRKGRHVLQFTCCNAPLDDAVLVAVARDVLARLGP